MGCERVRIEYIRDIRKYILFKSFHIPWYIIWKNYYVMCLIHLHYLSNDLYSYSLINPEFLKIRIL